jgi:hypothetical protein
MASNLLAHERLGHYEVGDQVFINKADALVAASATNADVYWNFNDKVFSAIDWSVPVEASLADLYRRRAQQLREKYDYISLYYSGGVDSTNVLHAFIDNDILLDEVVMYRPKVLAGTYNKEDLSNRNVFSEIKFAAIPHLRKHLRDPRTKVKFIEIDTSIKDFFANDALVSQFQTINLFMPTGAGRLSMHVTDAEWNQLYASGKKVCHLHGIDKPIIKLGEGRYFFQFIDTTVAPAVHVPKYTSHISEMWRNQQFHELFYWTPDLPQLVIKQCQAVKAIAGGLDHLFERSDRWKQDKFLFIHHTIYPEVVNSVRDLFCTEKPGPDIFAGQGSWLQERMDYTTKGVFDYIVANMQGKIHSRFFRGKGNTNYYLEDPDTGSPKTALRAIKSKPHYL